MSVLTRNNVKVVGSGTTPVMFSHGYGCDQNMWRFVAPEFGATHKAVLFDHVGSGGSDWSAYDFDKYATLDGYADDVLEIIEELDLRDVIFVGHSVSAMIGVIAANIAPERFQKLVMVGPSPKYVDAEDYVGGFSAPQIDELLATLDMNYLGWSHAMAPVIMANPDRPHLAQELETSFCRADPAIAKAFARTTFLSDTRRDLPLCRVPTLILQCANDVIAPEAVGRYVHEHMQGSALVMLKATGHCPNLSAPAETTAAIKAFLQ